jgi:hypothetical protein
MMMNPFSIFKLQKNLEDYQQFVKKATCRFEKAYFSPNLEREERREKREGGREGDRRPRFLFSSPTPKHKAGGILNQLQQV